MHFIRQATKLIFYSLTHRWLVNENAISSLSQAVQVCFYFKFDEASKRCRVPLKKMNEISHEISNQQLIKSPLLPFCLKTAETHFELDGVTLDGRSLWLPLKRCDSAFSSPSLSPMTPRRLSKAFSQEQSNDLSEPNSLSESNSTSTYGLPRSRSAEANVLLHPDSVPWSGGNGLSAPASLAPSRRGSSVHPMPETDHLSPHSSVPSSRRGSAVSAADVAAINVAQVTQMVSPLLKKNKNKMKFSKFVDKFALK